MSSVAWEILKAFEVAQIRAGQDWPYVYGGGHDPHKPFQPSESTIHPVKGVIGYDCSALASDVINRITPLGKAMATPELIKWGLHGEGENFTLWVAQYDNVFEHCVCEFKLPEEPANRWFMAASTKAVPQTGWYTLPDNWVKEEPFPYTPRRWNKP